MVIGGSLGGMQALEWTLLHPDLVDSLAFIASTAHHSAWAIGLSEASVDGSFGTGTANYTAVYQSYYGITADGIVGSQTWNPI